MTSMPTSSANHPPTSPIVHRAREVLVAFLFTFVTARVLVYLIMARRIPNMYAHAGTTHVHHLNYGIFLLTIAVGLTFDEFGMWLHLDTTYWQRGSFDAVTVIAAVLGLISAAPAIRRFRPQHWVTTALLLALLGGFAYLLVEGANHLGRRIGPSFQRLEESGPSEE